MNQRRSISSSTTTSTSAANSKTLRFEDGAIQFRQRIVVAILSHRPLLLRNIRSNSHNSTADNHDTLLFGLQAHEASFLRLIDQMTNGSHIEINASGTQLLFKPGILLGGSIQHDCPIDVIPTTSSAASATMATPQSAASATITTTNSTTINFVTTRSIGWYIEGILPLAPFGKEPLSITFTGITDGLCAHDPSCDYLRASALPILCRFLGLSTKPSRDDHDPLDAHSTPPTIRVGRRGAAPLGGGTASFYSPVVRSALVPLDLTDMGKFKRVRGTATTTKLVSSSLAARVAYAGKGVLHQLLPDVWIHTDNYTVKQHGCGPSPSCSLLLTAESTTGVTMSAEVCLDTLATSSRELPEDVGVRGAIALLEEIRRGGCVDTGVQSLVVLLMCLTPEDVSRVRIGTLSPYTIESLRLLKMALGVEFKCRPDPETKTILLSCLGTGYKNMARAST
jgi:RNA 3'-terminal phosphate cyclase-like protein